MSKPTAKLLQVLLWYDEPQIVLLESQPLQYIVGLAIEKDGAECPFVGASVSIRQLLDYKLQRIDLRYLFNHADIRRWWYFDLAASGDEIELTRLKGKDPMVLDAAPETGFFSRMHDEIENLPVEVANTAQQFDIDGTWDLGEFSQFYGQIEDIYYMFHSVTVYNNPSTSINKRNRIHEALVRPFRGGGSYVGLYNDIANDNDRAARLRVSGIQYHSPGYVEMRALAKPFDQTLQLLSAFAADADKIMAAYRNLHGTLSKNKLLKKENSSYISSEIKQLIETQTKILCALLPNIDFTDFVKISGDNQLVASKVILSIVRRVEKLNQFFDEGRAKHEKIIVA